MTITISDIEAAAYRGTMRAFSEGAMGGAIATPATSKNKAALLQSDIAGKVAKWQERQAARAAHKL